MKSARKSIVGSMGDDHHFGCIPMHLNEVVGNQRIGDNTEKLPLRNQIHCRLRDARPNRTLLLLLTKL